MDTNKSLKKSLIRLLPHGMYDLLNSVYNIYVKSHVVKSYSQEGEDRILYRFFENQKFGFYIDIGAHHPKRFSNTYLFYLRGWHGINIDATPGSMKAFNALRKRDINIECGVGENTGRFLYYIFNESALNRFSKELAIERHESSNEYKIIATEYIEIKPLAQILSDHVPPNQDIDFLSVDTEGFDLQVIRSNDWERFRPKIVLVEIIGKCLMEVNNDPVTIFLKDCNYSLFSKSVNTVFFKNNDLNTP